MKKNMSILVVIAAMVFSFAGSGFAKCQGGQCPLKGAGKRGECSSGKGQCPIVAKLMKKAHIFLENQQELGLKEDQITAIKEIKLEAKKTQIRQFAEMQVLKMDLDAKLSEPQLDVEGINGIIDEMAAGMTVSGKAAAASYAKLRAILTAEQYTKLKQIWLQHEASEPAHS